MNLKKTLIAAAAVSLLGGASFVVASSSRNSSDLFMANVDALADGENSPGEIVRKFLVVKAGKGYAFLERLQLEG